VRDLAGAIQYVQLDVFAGIEGDAGAQADVAIPADD
jgi:hypothetical protein